MFELKFAITEQKSVSSGCLHSAEWKGGMEWWNGMVEWNTGMVEWNSYMRRTVTMCVRSTWHVFFMCLISVSSAAV